MNNLVKKSTQDPWLRDFFNIENVFGGLPAHNGSLPAVNVSESEKSYDVEVVAPGFKKEDFSINVNDDILTISAETKTESKEENKDKQYSRREYSYSSFTRSFRLPDNAKDDGVSAAYKDGILQLTIPKTAAQVKAKKQVQVQ